MIKFTDSVVQRKSFLCVGLDPDLDKFPQRYTLKEGSIDDTYILLRQFLMDFIRSTHEFAAVYKPNLAFFGQFGLMGMKILKEVIDVCRAKEVPVILDGKFGDIGNTAEKYAKMAFTEFGANAATLNPWMGVDAIKPFLAYENCFSFILAVTSNPSSSDIQTKEMVSGKMAFQEMIDTFEEQLPTHNWGYVVGATKPEALESIRQRTDRMFLIPGIGKQGGSVQEVIDNAFVGDSGNLLINVSRSLMYPENWQSVDSWTTEAQKLNTQIQEAIKNKSH